MGEWQQKENSHHFAEDQDHDLSGYYVLVSNRFYYFGKKSVKIPAKYSSIVKKGPGHKSNFNQEFIDSFLEWLQTNFKEGIHAPPLEYESKCSQF